MTDQHIRTKALDPSESFIVQAPAGSGKTELLIQRLLVLLGRVNRPEEILAITFTRKAASEMRERLLQALSVAATQPAPSQLHARTTWQLAQAVLKRDQQHHWQLLHNPNRLIIQTIDALSLSLVKRMPILSHLGAPPVMSNDPQTCFTQAVENFLCSLETEVPWTPAMKVLLRHLDNNIPLVQRLLQDMLSKRDQWLVHLLTFQNEADANQQLKGLLETSLKRIVESTLTQVQQALTSEQKEALFQCISFAGDNLASSPLTTLKALPQADSADLAAWRAIAIMLLNKEGKFRKSVTLAQGFPAPSQCPDRQEQYQRQVMKARMQALLKQLSDSPDCASKFQAILTCPPAHYSIQQWELVTALVEILPIVCAELTLVFQQRHEIDFIEINQRAIQALGSPEAPTDLALSMDYQIKHLLVDEFQDTSTTQLRLFERLTADWRNDDGRTLFLVGDPMQSIYRFRQAEVGLFLRAQSQGLGEIKLTPLRLSMNFRSTAPLVNWLNATFTKAFPQQEDIATGAVRFHPAVASNDAQSQAVTFHSQLSDDMTAEADEVVCIVRRTQQQAVDDTIAILVKSRNHLPAILMALQQANLPYQAIDIETLADRAAIRDVVSLTRALLHPADRIAWLALLRAPWCGLTLTDLHALVADDFTTPIWAQVLTHEDNMNLSADAHARLAKLIPVLSHSINARQTTTLTQWVESTWLRLGGAGLLHCQADLLNIKAYFNLLTSLESERENLDAHGLQQQLLTLYAAPNPDADERLQVMTIHKAKGLEFDSVILPGLTRKPPVDAHQLLLWMERPTLAANIDLILAPIKSSITDDPIYRYLRLQDQLKADFEKTRLLYVAATRAKKALHLMLSLPLDPIKDTLTEPPTQSLVAPIWPMIQAQVRQQLAQVHQKANAKVTCQNKATKLERIALDATLPSFNQHLLDFSGESSAAAMTDRATSVEVHSPEQAAIGTVMHQVLEKIGQQGLACVNETFINSQLAVWRKKLLQAGCAQTALAEPLTRLQQMILNISQDADAQWIFSDQHTDIHNEYALTATINNTLVHVVIDRTFIDCEGTRWIIDYKMAEPKDESRERFIEAQKQQYQPQLNIYAKVLTLQEQRPLKTALYFPFLCPDGFIQVTETTQIT